MVDIIKYYENKEFANSILNDNNRYLLFEISENSEEALEEKCKKILSFQSIEWKPLLIKRHTFVNVYTKIFYINKY